MKTNNKFKLRAKEKAAYLELVLAFPLSSIRSEEHFTAAQRILDHLIMKRMNAGESLYFDALCDLVEKYDDEHYPMPEPSDAAMLQHFLDAKGITAAELHRGTGLPKSSISEVLSGKKPFSRQMIRKLSAFFKVDASLLAANF